MGLMTLWKKDQVFSLFRGKGEGPVKLTLHLRRVQNPPKNLLANFEVTKSKSLSYDLKKNFDLKISRDKIQVFPFFGGKGGSDQTDTTLRRGAESPKESFDQL